ncbi:dnaJ homolog subfamily C member 30, mitochondrial-like [Musca vetustissima]|uniref:dnaJ homolog subfamily C member 30, mitochondrial-like n=1 Tax=Musca vetustissima TaxID=27455 RepID=UPI002AB5E30B|nr:dnaJ homolog subfamily C member 30, mitochondrial-like [Musca vetustissima]
MLESRAANYYVFAAAKWCQLLHSLRRLGDNTKSYPRRNKKFREITQAYEILGNFRLRKLYDKGILHTAGPQYAQKEHEAPEPDDPSTRFYKSRLRKSKVADSQGRTPMYDFDEWTKQHYGDSFQRRRTAKEQYDHKKRQERDDLLILQKEIVLGCVILFSALAYMKFYSESSYDLPKEKTIRVDESKDRNLKDVKDSTT